MLGADGGLEKGRWEKRLQVEGLRVNLRWKLAKVTQALRRVSDSQYVLRHDYFTNVTVPALSLGVGAARLGVQRL